MRRIPDGERLLAFSVDSNVFWILVGNIVYAGSQWGLLVILAKFGSPEMVGQFVLGLAICTPIFVLTSLKLRVAQATDARNEYQFEDYLALRLLSTLGAMVVLAVVLLWSPYQGKVALVVLLVALAKALESISDVIYGVFQKQERLDKMAISMVTRGAGSVLVLGIAIYFFQDLVLSLLVLVMWWAIVLVGYDGPACRRILERYWGGGQRFVPRWNWIILRSLFWLSLPLGVEVMLNSLSIYIPRYYVELQLGEAALGYFGAIAQLPLAGIIFVNSIGQAGTARLAKYHVEDRDTFNASLVKLVAVSLLLGLLGVIVCILIGRELLAVLYRPDYAEYSDLLVWLMLAAGMSYVVGALRFGLSAARIFRAQVLISALASLGTLVGCHYLVPRYGLIGGAYGWIAGTLVALVTATAVLSLYLRRDSDTEERV